MHRLAPLLAAAVAARRPVAERLFVAVEVEAAALEACAGGGCRAAGLVEAQCDTWVRGLKAVAFFGDERDAALPAACAGRAYRPCAEANLGGDLSSAQLKREHLHLQLLGAAPADADWFVTTEQDVWWHAARLHAYLEAIEHKFPDAHAAPFFAGGYEGPFLVMNRRFVEAVVGNATFVDRCRAALLEFLAQPHVHPHKGDKGDTGGKRRLGGRAKCHRADGSSCAAEAPYNNDLLVRWCAQRSGARDANPECPRKCRQAFAALELPCAPGAGGALALYNNGHHGAAPYPASDYAGPLPGTLLAFHRVDARGARALENRSRAAAPGPAPAAACRVYRP